MGGESGRGQDWTLEKVRLSREVGAPSEPPGRSWGPSLEDWDCPLQWSAA